MGSLFWILAVLGLQSVVNGQSWKKYPLVLEDNPALTFPGIEGAQYQGQGDSWFFTAQVTGANTGKKYQVVTITSRNYISDLIRLNFYQASIFDYATGAFNTFTQYDIPPISLLAEGFRAESSYLNVSFQTPAGKASWTTARQPSGALQPFVYNLNCPGTDHVTSSPFSFVLHADMQKPPVAYGSSELRGEFTFYAQNNTLSYWQPAPLMNGSITFNGITEPVTGFKGHIDRQIFPLYAGVYTPTGRQHSHEWTQINLDNGIDLGIWRQFDRLQNNTVIPTTGSSVSFRAGSSPTDEWVDGLPADLTVEWIEFVKYPYDKFSTLLPPPSENMYLPTTHILRSKALNMSLTSRYTTSAPVAQLPIEYFEGPANWEGTFMGNSVSGIGIFETTMGLYQDWELADVLYISVSHLPTTSFSATTPKAEVLKAIQGLKALVSSNPLQNQILLAGPYARKHVIPALQTMQEPKRTEMLEIAQDFLSSLLLL